MLIIASELQRLHHGSELDGGVVIASWESPARAAYVTEALIASGRRITPADPPDLEELHLIHDRGYLEFLASAWDQWIAAGHQGPAAMGFAFPPRSAYRISSPHPEARSDEAQVPDTPRPDNIEGLLGYYSFAVDCSIGEHTWEAALGSVACAQTAATRLSRGERAAFALCRPPGHHATANQFGGYCYLNNAAAAAQRLLTHGMHRIAVIDVDYHHGNGTQDIFYHRDDVLMASIHCDPRQQFPYFSGYADEIGTGAGRGWNLNVPLPRGTTASRWMEGLDTILERVQAAQVDAVVVSLGLDTFAHDPISDFGLEREDFTQMGAILAGMECPTLFVLEGGYATEELGHNTVAVLDGFSGAAAS